MKIIADLVIGSAVYLCISMLAAYPTMWIVNYLFAAQLLTLVFGCAKIAFWKAFVLNMFFMVAFKGTALSSKD